MALHSILFAYRDTIEESITRFSMGEATVKRNLLRILDELENRFVSRSDEKAGRIGFQCREDEAYPKLRALRRRLSDDALEEDLDAINGIIHIYGTHSEKREKLLDNLDKASDFFNLFHDEQLRTSGPDSPCTAEFSNYLLVHIWNLTKTLFDAIESNWRLCKESDCTSHASRQTRLHLTEHQRFETAGGSVSLNSKERFRILFSTSPRDLSWQSTEITATSLDYAKERVKVQHKPMENGLCETIQGVKEDLCPQMAIYGHKLWNLGTRSVRDITRNQPPSPAQLSNRDFKTLTDLLRPSENRREHSLSSMQARDRLILSFILTTSLLRFFRGPWLQASFCSDNICFLVFNGSEPDITKPYLTTNCSAPLESGPPPVDLAQPHPFPDILSLGILLLEIARGDIIDIPQHQDRCSIALKHMEEWTRPQADRMRPIYGYLHQAISACISPSNLRNDRLDEMDVNEKKARKYIFERILWPLESALSDAYNVKPNTLNTDIAPEEQPIGLGAFDHKDEDSSGKQKAAGHWLKCLGGVHNLLDEYQERSRKLRKEAVKVAVLDTGLQISWKSLQDNYIEDKRISTEQSEDFVRYEGEESIRGWDVDCDGHGSRVGEIVLQVAPKAVLHVAKVFRHKDDLTDPKISEQVHKQIAHASSFDEAIERASYDWKVDMIVMSFGFDRPIPSIRRVIGKVSKMESPPLFFAATRNDGANIGIAWPAKDSRVIGISSTDGYGVRSEFNPTEDETSSPILHAFGECVPVTAEEPQVGEHMSGTSYSNPGPTAKPHEKHVSGTSYATPMAAALVSNLVACVRMIVATSVGELKSYDRVPERLRKLNANDMVAVLRTHIEKKHNSGNRSLLPWDFLKGGDQGILKDLDETLEKILGKE
ncbi:hypothetical protein INS49_012717 [Diaporthe citri]|uniref:uncharacterized protein n=1 Tax=Diaporthe citri TaxID=83186 RepID=UPI001C80A9B5|nr:uncharacterized protein INS49_012717 [Diaporthe citri]KAG6359197.1 hypothetical protein INS49_012717 [Diaporthe citri]